MCVCVNLRYFLFCSVAKSSTTSSICSLRTEGDSLTDDSIKTIEILRKQYQLVLSKEINIARFVEATEVSMTSTPPATSTSEISFAESDFEKAIGSVSVYSILGTHSSSSILIRQYKISIASHSAHFGESFETVSSLRAEELPTWLLYKKEQSDSKKTTDQLN